MTDVRYLFSEIVANGVSYGMFRDRFGIAPRPPAGVAGFIVQVGRSYMVNRCLVLAK